jgi:hypothetical protein
MPIARNSSMSGSAPDSSQTALLILDMISDFEFEDGARLCREALKVAKPIARLMSATWNSWFRAIVSRRNRSPR